MTQRVELVNTTITTGQPLNANIILHQKCGCRRYSSAVHTQAWESDSYRMSCVIQFLPRVPDTYICGSSLTHTFVIRDFKYDCRCDMRRARIMNILITYYFYYYSLLLTIID